MTNPDADPPDDPWLTLAEIADELRLSPATIRSWISKGTLHAMRAGQRKWLVRRSELDRMLKGASGPDDNDLGDDEWIMQETILPPQRSPHWGPEARQGVTQDGWLRVAEWEWQAALQMSAMAPPDAWFAMRIRQIAEAAARKAAALEVFESEPEAKARTRMGPRKAVLSYELRPGGNRPGPAGLWARFDKAVERLVEAQEGGSVKDAQKALEHLSLVMHELADDVEQLKTPFEDFREPTVGTIEKMRRGGTPEKS